MGSDHFLFSLCCGEPKKLKHLQEASVGIQLPVLLNRPRSKGQPAALASPLPGSLFVLKYTHHTHTHTHTDTGNVVKPRFTVKSYWFPVRCQRGCVCVCACVFTTEGVNCLALCVQLAGKPALEHQRGQRRRGVFSQSYWFPVRARNRWLQRERKWWW